MAGITFSEGEIKRLILALAGSRSMATEEAPPEEESPKHEAEKSHEGSSCEGDNEPTTLHPPIFWYLGH